MSVMTIFRKKKMSWLGATCTHDWHNKDAISWPDFGGRATMQSIHHSIRHFWIAALQMRRRRDIICLSLASIGHLPILHILFNKMKRLACIIQFEYLTSFNWLPLRLKNKNTPCRVQDANDRGGTKFDSGLELSTPSIPNYRSFDFFTINLTIYLI